MLKSYLKIAWRNMARNKAAAIINVASLSLGLTCCILIYLWIQDEKSIDNFHANRNSLYVAYTTTRANGKTDGSFATPLDVSEGTIQLPFENLPQVIPQVKDVTFYATGYELPWGHPESFQAGDKILKLDGSRAGKDFFKMFSYPLIQGNVNSALSQMNGIAISRKMANMFFGSPAKAMGKTLQYENRLPFIVTGVFENLPQQSSLHFDFLFNMEAQKKLLEWSSNTLLAYVQLGEKADSKKVEAAINAYLQPRINKDKNVTQTIGLQRLGDQYLHHIFINGKPVEGRIQYVQIFSLIALFILLIACINFMNLATAKSVKRAKEVGIRKVVGSSRNYLITQFLSESMFFAFLSMVLSIGLLYLLLPAFNSFTGKNITVPVTQISFWTFLIGVVLMTGMLAGSYPALYLSTLNPIRVLKGKLQFTQGSLLLRRGLTVFQFVLSIALIISTIVITRQINFIQGSHLGFNRDNLLYIRIEGELGTKNNYQLFKNEALQMPGIAAVDRSSEAPHNMSFAVDDASWKADDAINWEGKKANEHVPFLPASVGFDFLKLMNLQVVQGRGFSQDIANDSSDAFVVNEEAVKEMGMKNPLGKWISAWQKKGHIIGVVKDYNTQSAREKIKPLVIDVKEGEYFGVILVRTKPGETKQALTSLEKLYKSVNPNYAFAYQFVEEEYQKLYSNEIVISKLSALFATLAIGISCLGLLGLAMFSAEQRVKEISVRKVLGASVSQLVALFSQEFVKLVLIAFLIAAPVAWYAMNSWLQGFAYQTTLPWWIFVSAGIISVFITLVTIAFQSVKTATANPVKSLRTE